MMIRSNYLNQSSSFIQGSVGSDTQFCFGNARSKISTSWVVIHWITVVENHRSNATTFQLGDKLVHASIIALSKIYWS